jgi:hypothetical protein
VTRKEFTAEAKRTRFCLKRIEGDSNTTLLEKIDGKSKAT